MGQYVSAMSNRAFGGQTRGGTRSSRETTLRRGRKQIEELAAKLNIDIKGSIVSAAERFFKICSENNLIQGRRSANICAVCLYLVCRIQKQPHLLIDFSHILEVNVFVLGNLFLRIKDIVLMGDRNGLPLIDPSLYIERFAEGMQFGKKKRDVANTALLILRRFKRDWITVGRRPTGLCAAALLMAARLHNFKRSQAEVRLYNLSHSLYLVIHITPIHTDTKSSPYHKRYTGKSFERFRDDTS